MEHKIYPTAYAENSNGTRRKLSDEERVYFEKILAKSLEETTKSYNEELPWQN